jgi:hypothetical protein
MARQATDAEVLAVAEAGTAAVTIETLARAYAVMQVARLAARELDELRDWREQQ